MSARPPRVGVVGGGIAGVVAARRLVAAGARVILWERDDRLGGCLRTVDFAGARVDVGAESLHSSAPGLADLLSSAGLAAAVVGARPGRTWLETSRGVRRLPDGVGPAGPTRLLPLVTSGLLTPAGLLRAALEPVLPRRLPEGDVSVAEAVAARFGDEVVDTVVGPLLGGLHAGDVRELSLQAAAPQLSATLSRHRSVVVAGLRRGRSDHQFLTVRGGLQRLVEEMTSETVLDVRTGVAVGSVEDTGAEPGRYRVRTDAVEDELDGVVVAVPPAAAGTLLAGLSTPVRDALLTRRAATVAVVLLAYPPGSGPAAEDATGLLVPPSTGRLLRAATFLTAKWPHLASDRQVLVRASAGRVGDDRVGSLEDEELVGRLVADLADLGGPDVAPRATSVTRWPQGMPQLEVGQRAWATGTRAELAAAHPAVALAGAGYDGVGVAAAVRSGETAAAQVAAALGLGPQNATTEPGGAS